MSAPVILSGLATSNYQLKDNNHLMNIKKYHHRIQSSKSTSSERFILVVMVENTSLFCLRSGIGNSILRSNLPGRSRAGSKVSWRLVAMITYDSAYNTWMRSGNDYSHKCVAGHFNGMDNSKSGIFKSNYYSTFTLTV